MSAPHRNIALVAACPFPSPQGSQVFVGQMAERLSAAGHNVHLLTYGQGFEQTGRGYRHHRLMRLPGDDSRRSGPNLAKPILDAMLAVRLAKLVQQHNIEVVHAHNYEAAIAALAARSRTGIPVVYHSHNLMGDELESYFEGAAARRLATTAGEFLDRTVPRRVDRVIALCDWSADRLRRAGCAASHLSVIPPAVEDDGALEPDPQYRASLGLAEDDFVVGYCGNLDGYQNLGVLFRAFGFLLRGGNRSSGTAPVRLLIASHSISDEFRQQTATLGFGDAVRLIEVEGHAEARRTVAVSDLLALPRRLGSGYPVKLLNYMSAAKAVVTGGCGSKVLRDGIDGLVVADDDAEVLAQAIDRCRRDPRRCAELGKAARRTYLERLTWGTVLPQIEGVYAGLRESAAHSEHGS